MVDGRWSIDGMCLYRFNDSYRLTVNDDYEVISFPVNNSHWDVSAFVRLFYILSKIKIFRIFRKILLSFSQ